MVATKLAQMYERKLFTQYQTEVQLHHPMFFERLRAVCPCLTRPDIWICMLMRLGLTVDEIKFQLKLEEGSYYNRCWKLRKKLGLNEGENLALFLMAL